MTAVQQHHSHAPLPSLDSLADRRREIRLALKGRTTVSIEGILTKVAANRPYKYKHTPWQNQSLSELLLRSIPEWNALTLEQVTSAMSRKYLRNFRQLIQLLWVNLFKLRPPAITRWCHTVCAMAIWNRALEEQNRRNLTISFCGVEHLELTILR